MEPTNNPIPNPTPTPDPATPAGPVPEPVTPPVVPVEPVAPVVPVAPVAPAAPVEPVAPVPEPVVPAPEPVAPVAPVVQSGLSSAPASEPGVPVPAEVAPVVDTVPLKPADPVPGSIGSAVSVPADGNTGTDTIEDTFKAAEPATPSVPFNDPAVDPSVAAASAAPAKKSSKGTLIALIVVAAIVVIALAAVLVMQLMGDNGNNNGGSYTPDTSNKTPDEEPDEEPEEETKTLSCSRSLTPDEVLAQGEGVMSGSIAITASFVDEELTTISVVKAIMTQIEGDESGSGTTTYDKKEITADKINATNAADYYLAPNAANIVDTSLSNTRATYEGLAFVCEVL